MAQDMGRHMAASAIRLATLLLWGHSGARALGTTSAFASSRVSARPLQAGGFSRRAASPNQVRPRHRWLMSGGGQWIPFLRNEGVWSGQLVRYAPDMSRLAGGATTVTATKVDDHIVIALDRDEHMGPRGEATFSRQQLDRLCDAGSDVGWERPLELAVSTCPDSVGSYCMGPFSIEQEFVGCEQSVLLGDRRLRAACRFQLTMVGPCSPDLQLSLLSLSVFTEVRKGATRAGRERTAVDEEVDASWRQLPGDSSWGGAISCKGAPTHWHLTAGEFVSPFPIPHADREGAHCRLRRPLSYVSR
jgi:hypothetical protein